MKKAILVVLCCAVTMNLAFAAQDTKADAKSTEAKVPPKSNFKMISGTITKIDTADPANVKLEVKSERDNAIHTVTLMPWTNITKVTDVSELRQGEAVRVMARTAEGKEVAMGVLFGKIKK